MNGDGVNVPWLKKPSKPCGVDGETPIWITGGSVVYRWLNNVHSPGKSGQVI